LGRLLHADAILYARSSQAAQTTALCELVDMVLPQSSVQERYEMSYRDYGYTKRYDPYEARVRRLLGRLGILALVVLVTFALFALCFPNDWLRP
jgi:hypothetical protein